jgi:hypothetical protein
VIAGGKDGGKISSSGAFTYYSFKIMNVLTYSADKISTPLDHNSGCQSCDSNANAGDEDYI